MLDRARRKHGALTDLLAPVFEEKQRQIDIAKRRGVIEGKDHRFFLAVLAKPEILMSSLEERFLQSG
jgi:hypothetical protein